MDRLPINSGKMGDGTRPSTSRSENSGNSELLERFRKAYGVAEKPHGKHLAGEQGGNSGRGEIESKIDETGWHEKAEQSTNVLISLEDAQKTATDIMGNKYYHQIPEIQ